MYNEAAVNLWERRPVLNTEMWCGSYKLFTADGIQLNHNECPMAVSIKSHAPVREVEAKMQTLEGKIKDFIAYTTPIWDGLNSFTGAMNVMVDISERKRNEQELTLRKKFLSTLIGNVPGIVYQFAIRPSASMKYISPQVEKITGYSADEFLSGKLSPGEVIDRRDRSQLKSHVVAALQSDSAYDVEYRIHTKEGEV
jgi:two-component system, chemotaxis family, CheB/CheR fusion protein